MRYIARLMKLDSRATIASEPDSCWVAPRGDKGRYFSTALSSDSQKREATREGGTLDAEEFQSGRTEKAEKADNVRSSKAPFFLETLIRAKPEAFARNVTRRPESIRAAPAINQYLSLGSPARQRFDELAAPKEAKPRFPRKLLI